MSRALCAGAILFLGLAISPLLGADEVAAPLEEKDVVGFWKLSYEPGLRDVLEPSQGYRAILPAGQYYEMTHSYCGEDASDSRGRLERYRFEGQFIFFEHERWDGKKYEIRSRLLRQAKVVLFDDLDGPPVTTDVLVVDDGDEPVSLNYAFAKIFYPEPKR